METLCASDSHKCGSVTIDAHWPWAIDLLQTRTTKFAFEGSINRYYDPSTDQFLSVDPLVQQTDQPYAFVNDDPLNATDPLGLKGSIGSMCNGSRICETTDLKIIRKTAPSPNLKHIVLGLGGCVGLCGSISFQDGTLTIAGGGSGIALKGPYIGYSKELPSQRQSTDALLAGGFFVGGSVEVGVRPNLTVDRKDEEFDVGGGYGVGGGLTWSIHWHF
jgi:RHS repeat-associated protein